jgi:hypothetical protein
LEEESMLPALLFVALTCLALLVCVCVCIFGGRREQAAFVERFPPISDDEFLARCSPGTSREVALKVRRIVADYFGIEYERVHPSTRFVEDIGAE